MIYTDNFSSVQGYILILYQECKHFSNCTNVMLLVLHYACEGLNNSLKFMFIWYDMAFCSDNGPKFVCVCVFFFFNYYDVIWQTSLIIV